MAGFRKKGFKYTPQRLYDSAGTYMGMAFTRKKTTKRRKARKK